MLDCRPLSNGMTRQKTNHHLSNETRAQALGRGRGGGGWASTSSSSTSIADHQHLLVFAVNPAVAQVQNSGIGPQAGGAPAPTVRV